MIFDIERHLEKTPIAYIQWRFQDGHDREHCAAIYYYLMLMDILGELLEKATRVLTVEEKKILEQDWVGKDGSKRKLEVRGLSCVKFVNN
jgi:elongation factor 3